MIYKVLLDGTSVYESDGNVIIEEPHLSQEINTAGSFEFKIPPMNLYYDRPMLLTPEVEVYEGNNLIFFGRPTEIEMDMDLAKHVYCEGALAYFSDSIQEPFTFDEIDRRDFLGYLVEKHNEKVPQNRQFEVGNVTMTEKLVFRSTENYETTLDCLNKYLLDAEGGYLMVRKENGVRYIDWYSDIPWNNLQPVRFALNLIDLTQKITADFFTSIIPIGADGLTIAAVNGGRVFLDSDYIDDYGRITGVVEFNDCSDANELMLLGLLYLSEQRYTNATINCKAAELHYINNEYTPFLIGQNVHVVSPPHSIDAVLPIVKLDLNLDKADKEIEIGTLDRKTLTEIVKDSEGKAASGTSISFDPTPTEGSKKAVTSAGIYTALGPLRFTVNEDGTVRVKEAKGEIQNG